MSSSPSPESDPARARWGDRVGRRRDILRAASQLLETRGYTAFSIRNIARGAGVSAATLYSYFATKEEIFATLQIQRFQDLRSALEQLEQDGPGSVESLFVRLMPELVDLWQNFGQNIGAWMQSTDPNPTIRSLAFAFRDATNGLESALRSTAAREERRLNDDLLMPYLWSGLFGVASQHVQKMHDILGYSPDELTRRAARGLVDGITASEPADA